MKQQISNWIKIQKILRLKYVDFDKRSFILSSFLLSNFSPYGDIQTNRNQNRYSAPSLNNPRARYSTEYDHRFSTEIPVNAAHPQNDSAYKLERIRQNIGGSNGAALNRYSQGSTDALGSPKTDKQKENARNVVTRAVSQKMLR